MDPFTIAAVGGGLLNFISSNKATKAQQGSANDQIAFANKINDQNVARFAPYAEMGQNALAQYGVQLGLGTDENPMDSPYFQNILYGGMDAIEAGAAARGNLLSGSTLKALEDHRMKTVGQFQENYLSRLAGLTQMGQNSAGMQANQSNIMGNQVNNALAAYGNAGAANAMNMGDNFTNLINNGLGAYAYMQGA